MWCQCCSRPRPAGECVVYAYYDGPQFFCAPEQGCQDPAVIAAKRARAFRNRSLGQKARWARRRAG